MNHNQKILRNAFEHMDYLYGTHGTAKAFPDNRPFVEFMKNANGDIYIRFASRLKNSKK